MGDLRLDLALEEAVGAAQQDVRLDTEAGQLLHAVLRRLRLHLAGGADERHQRQVNVQNVLAAAVPAELANGFEERQAFDVTDRAADFADDDIVAFRGLQDAPFDLVGDVRDHLHGAAEVLAVALVGDDAVVYLPGG